MAATAELTLILRAQNLADIELNKIRAGLEKITVTAKTVAGDVAAAFKGMGSRIARQMGNVAQDLLSGSSLTQSLAAVGITAAGALVEGLMTTLIPSLGAKFAASATFGPAIAAMTASGTSLGGVLAGAIALGVAALPFLLAAAAVAALVYLLTNPAVLEGARRVGRKLGNTIATALADAMSNAPPKINTKYVPAGPRYGPAVSYGSNYGGYLRGHAAGGWVGQNGPEIGLLGEKGPEYVIPNHKLGSMGGVPVSLPIIIDGREVARIVDEHLYYDLRRASPTLARS